MRLLHVTVALALLTVPLAGCLGTEPGPSMGTGSLEWSFTDTDGETHTNGTAQGTPSVFFFMATWCTSCQDKADDLRAIHDAYADQGVDIYSISWDPQEDEEDLERWKSEYDQPWPHGNDPGLEMQQAFGVKGQSEVVVLDEDNQLIQHWGYDQANEEAIASILEDTLR